MIGNSFNSTNNVISGNLKRTVGLFWDADTLQIPSNLDLKASVKELTSMVSSFGNLEVAKVFGLESRFSNLFRESLRFGGYQAVCTSGDKADTLGSITSQILNWLYDFESRSPDDAPVIIIASLNDEFAQLLELLEKKNILCVLISEYIVGKTDELFQSTKAVFSWNKILSQAEASSTKTSQLALSTEFLETELKDKNVKNDIGIVGKSSDLTATEQSTSDDTQSGISSFEQDVGVFWDLQSLHLPLGMNSTIFVKELSKIVSCFSNSRTVGVAKAFGDERVMSGRVKDSLRSEGYEVVNCADGEGMPLLSETISTFIFNWLQHDSKDTFHSAQSTGRPCVVLMSLDVTLVPLIEKLRQMNVYVVVVSDTSVTSDGHNESLFNHADFKVKWKDIITVAKNAENNGVYRDHHAVVNTNHSSFISNASEASVDEQFSEYFNSNNFEHGGKEVDDYLLHSGVTSVATSTVNSFNQLPGIGTNMSGFHLAKRLAGRSGSVVSSGPSSALSSRSSSFIYPGGRFVPNAGSYGGGTGSGGTNSPHYSSQTATGQHRLSYADYINSPLRGVSPVSSTMNVLGGSSSGPGSGIPSPMYRGSYEEKDYPMGYSNSRYINELNRPEPLSSNHDRASNMNYNYPINNDNNHHRFERMKATFPREFMEGNRPSFDNHHHHSSASNSPFNMSNNTSQANSANSSYHNMLSNTQNSHWIEPFPVAINNSLDLALGQNNNMQYPALNRESSSDILESLSHEQICLFQSLSLAFATRNVKVAISTLRQIYTKQCRRFRIPNLLALIIPFTESISEATLNSSLAFTLNCIQWSFGGKRSDGVDSFKYKMNKNIARWLLKEQQRKGIPAPLPSDVMMMSVSVVQSILQNSAELDFCLDLLMATHITNPHEVLLSCVQSVRSPSGSAIPMSNDVMAQLSQFSATMSEARANSTLLSGGGGSVSGGPPQLSLPSSSSPWGNSSDQMMGNRLDALPSYNEHMNNISPPLPPSLQSTILSDPLRTYNSSQLAAHYLAESTASSILAAHSLATGSLEQTASLSMIEHRLLALLGKSSKGILGAHIPAIYREEYKEPLRLHGRKLKDILLGTNQVEMIGGAKSPGGKRFRLISADGENNEDLSDDIYDSNVYSMYNAEDFEAEMKEGMTGSGSVGGGPSSSEFSGGVGGMNEHGNKGSTTSNVGLWTSSLNLPSQLASRSRGGITGGGGNSYDEIHQQHPSQRGGGGGFGMVGQSHAVGSAIPPQFFAASGGQFRGESAGKYSSPSLYLNTSGSMLMSSAPTFTTTRQPIPSNIGSTGIVSNAIHTSSTGSNYPLPFSSGNLGRNGPELTRTPPPDIFGGGNGGGGSGGYYMNRG